MKAVLPLLLLASVVGCDADRTPRLLHDVPSPDGRYRMKVLLRPQSSGDPVVHATLEGADGTPLRGDAFKVKASPEDISPADLRVTWISETRVEVTGWKSGRRASVWQLEDGTWMDRRSDDDRRVGP